MMEKKYICAIIRKEDELLCHKVNDNGNKWEFPKILVNDDDIHNIEIIENHIKTELNLKIYYYAYMDTIKHENDSHIEILYVHLFNINVDQMPKNNINKNYNWVNIKDLYKINFLEENMKFLYVFQLSKKYDKIHIKNPSFETINILSRYITARQFKNAITYSHEIINERIYNRPIPYIVNLVFSCELYLKLICYIKGIKYKQNHGIYDLIKDSKTLIDILSDNNMKRYDEEYIICEFLKIDNSFKNWRYHYESDYNLSIDDRILKNLIDILENISIKLCDDNYPDAGINWGFINSIY